MRKLKRICSVVLGALVTLCTWSFSACSLIDGGNGSTLANGIQVKAEYDYNIAEGKAVMLYGHCDLFFQIPDEIDRVVSGDVFDIEHTGDALVLESYPGQMRITGKIKSVKVHKANIVRLTYYAPYNGEEEYFIWERDNGTSERIKVETRPNYYITGFDGEYGKYRELSKVSYSRTLFGSYSAIDGYNEEEGYSFSGLYEWHPRFEEREIDADTQTAITDLNNNSSFDYKLLSKVENCDFSEYEYEPGFGCERYTKDGATYGFSMYPDEACGEYCLTSIQQEGGFTLFGINSASATAEEICLALETHGYALSATVSDTLVQGACYGVSVSFVRESAESNWSVRIGLRTTNDTGIIY